MTERFELDPAHTTIGFTSKHLAVTTDRGTFQKFDRGEDHLRYRDHQVG